ncbi:MAG: hypothetical protein OEM60_09195 [Gammaproteobacteria bacterium]|nr:hypothetical protein [Gammaproteobacteria bacterium]MDH3431555.1 hypothetical protein [Gammaproteobacteria bacterium]MDH3434020.1 hypothetical protein [Gammaproteobacteria bacterium]
MRLGCWTIIALGSALVACGGPKELTCDDEAWYLSAVRAPRVQAPADLDNLPEFKEMPVPEASPQAPRAAYSKCLDAPPITISTD